MTPTPIYPGYPLKRLVIENINDATSLTLPDGEWSTGVYTYPTLDEQKRLREQGYKLDDFGRPLHPWLLEMLSNPEVGVVTGLGNYWHWGPNYAADPIVISTDDDPKVLLIQRGDTGAWALPGGFVDAGETGAEAARRELFEETGLIITGEPLKIYSGIVADSRATAHAWCETTAVLWRVDGTPKVQGLDGVIDAAWVPISELSELYGSHKVIVDHALKRLNEVEPTHSMSIETDASSYRNVSGGHMSYHRFIVTTNSGGLFIKSHDKHAFTNPVGEAHSRQYLRKEKNMYDHVANYGFEHVPKSINLIEDYTLVMEALPEEEGWHWRAPADNIDTYIQDIFTVIESLESTPLPDDFHDSEMPTHELLYRMGWGNEDLTNNWQYLQTKFERWYPRFHTHFRDAAKDLMRNPDTAHMFDTPINNDLVFAHHDLRQANIAWHPDHGVRIVDWSWTGTGAKNADATMLLIDLHKSGHDIAKYTDKFNPHHAWLLIGYWLRQCQLEPRTPNSSVRFQQALSAVSAYDLLMKNR